MYSVSVSPGVMDSTVLVFSVRSVVSRVKYLLLSVHNLIKYGVNHTPIFLNSIISDVVFHNMIQMVRFF